jgi:hypothetical protein
MISHIDQREIVKLKQMIVHFKDLCGGTHSFKLRPSDLIETAKEVFSELTNCPTDQLRFICAGKQLEDNRTFSSYNIQYGCTIHVVLRLRGC